MPVPTYPSAITLANIQTEFGGTNPASLNEYYSGGTYTAELVANTGLSVIPTSGAINFLDFEGAIQGRWWYHRMTPRASNDKFTKAYFGDKSMIVSPNGATLTLAGGSLYFQPYVLMIPTANGNTTYSYDIRDGASGVISTYARNAALSPNGLKALVCVGTGAICYYTANGTQIYSANNGSSPYALYPLLGNDGETLRVGYHQSFNNVVVSKWASNGTTCDWFYGQAFGQTTYVDKPMYNYDRSKIIIVGSYATNSVGMIQSFYANGTHAWGYKFTANTPAVGQLVTSAERTDSSNNFYVRCTNMARDIFKFTDNGATCTEAWRKAFPSGNNVLSISHDVGGNVFVGTYDGLNAHVSKVASDGSVIWSRRFRTASTRDTRNVLYVTNIQATAPNTLTMLVSTQGQYFDTGKGQWYDSANYELHILRVPQDGSKTGTYANLIYESMTAFSLSAQSAIGLTSNNWANTGITGFTANTASNTRTLLSNSTFSITSTTIS